MSITTDRQLNKMQGLSHSIVHSKFKEISENFRNKNQELIHPITSSKEKMRCSTPQDLKGLIMFKIIKISTGQHYLTNLHR